MSHTYAILDVSPEAYREIRDALKTAAYDHAFHEDGVIDMHGIALCPGRVGKASPARRWPDPPPAWPPPPEPWPEPPEGAS